MGLISITEMFAVLRRYFIHIVAAALLAALLMMLVVQSAQTYTCTLNYKYAHDQAAEGLAADNDTALNPYEIQEPLLIRGALDDMGVTEDIDVEKVRNNIYIEEVIEELEKEISDSAALIGEKYVVEPTEFKITYTYDAGWGEHFGAQFFDRLIRQYDEFLLKNYYSQREVVDFAKILVDSEAEYLDIAGSIDENINNIVQYLQEMNDYYPNFRSQRNGYSFGELATMYWKLHDIQYAKYYGNIRAGNLARDREVVIKNYQAQVDDLTLEYNIAKDTADAYYEEVQTFYDSYKKSGLYEQAQQAQSTLVGSNNRDESVLNDYDIPENLNTYDATIDSYTQYAIQAENLSQDIVLYNAIIEDYTNDTVSTATKNRLLEKNEVIFAEIANLSAVYAAYANEALTEFYQSQVNTDLRYRFVTDTQADLPMTLLVVIAFVVMFGATFIYLVILTMVRKKAPVQPEHEVDVEPETPLEAKLLAQYRKDFSDMYLVYQPMIATETNQVAEYEAYIRWEDSELGKIPPVDLIRSATDLGILPELNKWIIEQVCQNLALRKRNKQFVPVIHINCPYFMLDDFGITDVIMQYANQYGVDVHKICMEIDGPHVTARLSDVLLLQKIGVKICIDRFEDSTERDELIQAGIPNYVKLSARRMNIDWNGVETDDNRDAKRMQFIDEKAALIKLLYNCKKNGIMTCICGIETEVEHKFFTTGMEFDFKQGYLFGSPSVYDVNKE